MNEIKIIDCPRDAMQSWKSFIPTSKKIEYINQLLRVGFDTIDFGSFVSSKTIPQMRDTSEVVRSLEVAESRTKLLSIVANLRGASDAITFDEITYLGYPYSISPTFQKLNANSSIEESFNTVKEIQQLCKTHNKRLVIYLSMAFGNPYGEEYHVGTVLDAARDMAGIGIEIISLSDTVGVATPKQVGDLVKQTIDAFPEQEIGVHLHSTPDNWREKLDAALDNGCKRFDGAINGYGGCPMSGSDLVGNMNTGNMVRYFKEKGFLDNINLPELETAENMASQIFI